MFRVNRDGQGLGDAETIEGARGIVRGQPPGRYDVDEIRADPLASGHKPVVGPDDPASGRAGRG